jgi:hypothetical protein
MTLNVTVKRRLVVNGKEYDSVDELPEKVRAAYEKAVASGLIPGEGGAAPGGAGRIVVNGQAYDSVEAMPEDVRRLYEDAMAAAASQRPASPTAHAHDPRIPPIGRAAFKAVPLPISAAPIEPGSSGSPQRLVVAVLVSLLLLSLVAYLFLR